MSLRDVERAILEELKTVAKNPKLRLKDIQEWSTGNFKAQDGETLFHLPGLGVNVAVKLPPEKAKKVKATA